MTAIKEFHPEDEASPLKLKKKTSSLNFEKLDLNLIDPLNKQGNYSTKQSMSKIKLGFGPPGLPPRIQDSNRLSRVESMKATKEISLPSIKGASSKPPLSNSVTGSFWAERRRNQLQRSSRSSQTNLLRPILTNQGSQIV